MLFTMALKTNEKKSQRPISPRNWLRRRQAYAAVAVVKAGVEVANEQRANGSSKLCRWLYPWCTTVRAVMARQKKAN